MSEEHDWSMSEERWVPRIPKPAVLEPGESDDDKTKDTDLLFYDGDDRKVHFTDYLVSAAEAKEGLRFHCNFDAFDEKIGGLETGEVWVVSGYTKNGKTLFAESWIYSMMCRDPKAKVALFSFEVQTQKLLIKYMHNETLPIYVPKKLKTMDVDWLIDRCREAKLKFGCSIVFIDHLHFLVDMNTKTNMSLNIGAFMRRLKHEVAIGLDMAVILIAHQGQVKDGKEAGIGGIRDSSFIAQESDGVIVVSRRENYSPIDLSDFRIKYGEEKADKIVPPADSDDKYSANLAIVKVEVARRTGAFDYKKLFRKNGEFMEEI